MMVDINTPNNPTKSIPITIFLFEDKASFISAGPKGFAPSIFPVTGGRDNCYATAPAILTAK